MKLLKGGLTSLFTFCAVVVALWLASSASALAADSAQLLITATGLPKNVQASVVLNSRSGHRALRFAGSRSLRLAPGSYSVTVRDVVVKRSSRGVRRGAIAYPEKNRLRFNMKSEGTTRIAVGYRAVVNSGVLPLPDRILRVIGEPADPSALLLPNGSLPAPGTIYTAAPSASLPRGLISKVTKTKKTGAGVRVSLTAVPVTDAVPSLDFSGSIDLEPLGGASSSRLKLGAEHRSQALASASRACVPPKLVKFHAHLDDFELRQASLSAWPPQMRLTLAIRTTESLGVAAVAAGINCDWTLGQLGPYQAAIPVGPIVVPVYATVPVKAGIHVNGRFDVGTINVASTTVADVAAGAKENRGSLSEQGSNVWPSGVLSLSGSAKLYASAGVEAGIGVAKGANVHVAAGFGPEFDWSSGHTCDVYLNLGSLSAGVSVLGKNLNTPPFTPLRPRLWSGCGGDGGSGGSGGPGTGPAGGSGGEERGDPEDYGPLPPLAASRLDAGGTHTCFVSTGGQVFCWGSNQASELGNGTKVDSATPIEIPGIANAVGVTSGGEFSGALSDTGETCALLVGGTVSCWGYFQGPRVVEGLPPASDVSASALDTCALVGGGHVDCWPSPALPVERVEGVEGAIAISEGYGFGCALIASGEARCWGSNSAGQLGNGTFQSSPTAGPVQGISTAKAIDASGGGSHACAVLADGTVECWGWDGDEARELPVPVEGVATAVDVSVGDGHACALLESGAVDCWGYDRYGQLGFDSPRGYLPLYNTAHRVLGITQARQVSAGGQHTCALLVTGVECWGNNAAGQLGRQAGRYAFTPVEVAGLHDAIAISTGADRYYSRGHSCVVRSGGAVYCWGSNEAGQLGDGSFDFSPVPVSTGIGDAVAVGVGEMSSCAVLVDGSVDCWGAFTSADHSYGSETPQPIEGVEGAVAVATSSNIFSGGHTCALLDDGKVVCWGENEHGQLGLGDTGEHSTPELVSGVTGATGIAVGIKHSCALLEGGTIKCWGDNEVGQLGDGTREDRAWAVSVVGISTAVQLSAEGENTCAVLANGSVECWGSGFEGQFGSMVEAQTVPVAIQGLEHASTITAAPNQLCAILDSGGVACKRSGAWWEVGPFESSGGTTSGERLDLSSLSGTVALSAGNGHACALQATGDVACWGADNSGELGDGTVGWSSTPEFVPGLTQ
jgi:alpha-tubulin suppressor-like RCC1 family protein